MIKEKQHKELIVKYLEGKLKPDEVRQFTSWLKADTAHQRLLETEKENWFPEKGRDAELDQAASELRYKIGLNQSLENGFRKVARPARKILMNTIRIAAIFIAGVIVTQVLHLTIFSAGSADNVSCTVATERGQKSRLTLPDGTEVWLNTESKLAFSTEGFLADRQVELSGEAYFDVRHNDKKPFVVKTKAYDVEVLGTEFNVMAYEDIGRTETTLVKGKVKITKGEKELELNPGQKATFEANRLSIKEVNVEQANSWKRNELRYEGISFRELIFSLERWFDVQITMIDPSLYDVKYSGVFKNDETIEEVLEALKITTSINYEVKGSRQYEISFDE